MMKIIDVENWNRKSQFLNFSQYSHPTFSIGTRLDVTNLVLFCEKHNYSFFSAFLYVVTRCCNELEEMRTRIEDKNVVVYEKVHPSYVVMRDDNSIATCMTAFENDFESFYNETRKDIRQVKADKIERKFNSHSKTDCIYISCLQWIDITTISNPYNFSDTQQTSIPRITWGRYVKNSDNRYEMGFNISAHHGLMDGWHAAQVIGNIEQALENIETFCGG